MRSAPSTPRSNSRPALLKAAAALLADGHVPTIGAVATLAGVTKGAVQHHFANREALISAVGTDLLIRFNELTTQGERPRSPQVAARLYVDASLDLDDPPSSRALLVACATEPTVAEMWKRWLDEQRLPGTERDMEMRLLVARLAADGLWLSDALGMYGIDGEMREAVRTELHRIIGS